MRSILLVQLLFISCLLHAQPTIDRRVDSLLALMTLDEKVGQLVQETWRSSDTLIQGFGPDQRELIRRGRIGSFLNVIGVNAVREAQRIAVEESRLKIPLMFGFDVIHGFRTIFPIPLATACTWDLELIEQIERTAAVEATAAGIDWTFSPMVDIARDPRWGRIAEGAGEDPYLGSVIAAARVRGFQGNDLQDSTSLAACAKHFAAYGGAEGGRDYNTVDISERTLRETYLPSFRAAVNAGAATLMCSFNEIAGMPSSANRKLLTEILRGEWKFGGFVVSDWNSIGELVQHGIAANSKEAAALGVVAGVDMDMESNSYKDHLAALISSGKVSEADLNEAVRRVLRTKFRTGLFENPYKNCDPGREKVAMVTPEHRRVARMAAQRSIVLLKNEGNLLPLKREVRTLALIGPLADDKRNPLGPWYGNGNPTDVVSVREGIASKVSAKTTILFSQGCAIEGDTTNDFREAVAAARKADVVIAAVGESAEMSGEAASRSNIGLPGKQEGLIRALQAVGKPLVVVLMNGRPLAISWIAQNVPAIVESWFLGIETGNAIADLLFGDYNPSGKLTATFPRATGQIPVYYNHKNTGRPTNDVSRFTSRYIDLPSTPLFPFGYGLSFTTFSYSELTLNSGTMKPGDSLTVAVVVKNTGKRSGEEIVQLYLQDVAASITRPVKELKAFQRIPLAAGESKTVRFILRQEDLKFYDRSMQWRAEPGEFRVFVGPNSAEVKEVSFEYVSQQ